MKNLYNDYKSEEMNEFASKAMRTVHEDSYRRELESYSLILIQNTGMVLCKIVGFKQNPKDGRLIAEMEKFDVSSCDVNLKADVQCMFKQRSMRTLEDQTNEYFYTFDYERIEDNPKAVEIMEDTLVKLMKMCDDAPMSMEFEKDVDAGISI